MVHCLPYCQVFQSVSTQRTLSKVSPQQHASWAIDGGPSQAAKNEILSAAQANNFPIHVGLEDKELELAKLLELG